MGSPRILVVDDEIEILDLVVTYLKAEGYEVETAGDGRAALEAFASFQPALVVLDIMLPGIDGLEVLARLRRDSNVYVIMLTAKTEETDKIVGLSVGADDYMTKPFSPRELVARVKAALRRLGSDAGVIPANEDILQFRLLRIDRQAIRAWVGERELDLTALEFQMLLVLAENAGRVLTREQLLQKVWGYDYYGDDRVIDVHIGHLREKLGAREYIVTVRGVGYRFEDD